MSTTRQRDKVTGWNRPLQSRAPLSEVRRVANLLQCAPCWAKISFVRAKNHDRALFFPLQPDTRSALLSPRPAPEAIWKAAAHRPESANCPSDGGEHVSCGQSSKKLEVSLSLSLVLYLPLPLFSPSLHSLSLFLSPFFPSWCAFFLVSFCEGAEINNLPCNHAAFSRKIFVFYILPGVFGLRSSTLCLLKVNTSVITGGYWRCVALLILSLSSDFCWRIAQWSELELGVFPSRFPWLSSTHAVHTHSLATCDSATSGCQLFPIGKFFVFFWLGLQFRYPKKIQNFIKWGWWWKDSCSRGRWCNCVSFPPNFFFCYSKIFWNIFKHVCNLKKLCLTQIKIWSLDG